MQCENSHANSGNQGDSHQEKQPADITAGNTDEIVLFEEQTKNVRIVLKFVIILTISAMFNLGSDSEKAGC